MEKSTGLLAKIQESIRDMEVKIDEGQKVRDTKLALILQLQTR